MRRGWKILIGVVVGLGVLLTLNTIAVDQETKEAEVTVGGGEILRLAGGDLQVLDSGPRDAAPIVLLHCFSCSINSWDELVPLLERGGHRVIAIDLLGHGGSEKPRSGYSMENQAQLVAQALSQLGVEGATVVGHSMGATVAVALAEQSSELVDRLVLVGQAPDNSYGDSPLLAKLAFTPVIGEALNRVTPDFLIEDGLGETFAPGYDVPDQFVDDFNRLTYIAFDHSNGEEDAYMDEQPLDERLRAAFVPLLVIFGSEDQVYDAREALSAYAAIPGARTELIDGAGHSPNVEEPAPTAKLILEFATRAPAGSKRKSNGGGKPNAASRKPARHSGNSQNG